MKKSVKKVLGIYSLVMFCSVLLSNALFVSSSQAQALLPEKKASTNYVAKWGANNYQPTNNNTGQSSSSKANDAAELSSLKAKAATGIMTQAEYDKLGSLGVNTSNLNVVIKDAKSANSATSTNSGDNPTVIESSSAEAAASSTVNGGGTYTAPVGGAYCKNTTNVFETIACKIVTTLDDLRIVIYLIAGFGLIAFAFSAIFGKISWKHLGQLGFGLFLISMMAPFITYFTHPSDDGYKLKYGDYLPAGDFTAEFKKVGVSSVVQTDCKKIGDSQIDKGTYCLDEVVVAESKPAGSWSLKDLKGTVQSAIKTAQAAHSTLQATKAAVNEVKAQAQVVSGAIRNSGGGINGLMNIAGAVSNAGASLGQVGYTLGNNIQYNVAAAANSYQDSFLTNEQRAYNERQRAAGNQTNKLATTISDKQSGIVKKGENFYDAKGNKILVKANEQGQFVDASGKVLGDKVDAQGNLVTASKFGNIVTGAEKAREYGMKGSAALSSASNDSQNMNNMVGGVGGSFLGNVAGLVTLGASATGNLVDADMQIKNNAQAQKEAQGTQAASISGVKSSVSDKNGNNITKYNDGTEEKKNKDGSTSVKYPDGRVVEKTITGAIVEKNPDGSFVSKQKDGSITQVSADGSGVKVDKNGKLIAEYKDGNYSAIYDKQGNKTDLIRVGNGYVSQDANGNVINTYDNLGKLVKTDKK